MVRSILLETLLTKRSNCLSYSNTQARFLPSISIKASKMITFCSRWWDQRQWVILEIQEDWLWLSLEPDLVCTFLVDMSSSQNARSWNRLLSTLEMWARSCNWWRMKLILAREGWSWLRRLANLLRSAIPNTCTRLCKDNSSKSCEREVRVEKDNDFFFKSE